jgi:tRNA U34 5-methylaminomethyl-2-thiouridine-forming methyltransferase MnmC
MKKVITKDGSITYYNEEFNECYHAKSGAIEEALEKYVKPSKIIEIVKRKKEVVIFDICFGLGYNTLIALHEILKVNSDCEIKVIAFENDEKILKEILKIDLEFKEYDIIKRSISNLIQNNQPRTTSKNVTIEFHIGDAVKEIKKIKDKADVVFFDSFSIKKCPQLWTADFFKDIITKMNKGARLTNFTCSRVARLEMEKAGFKIIDGPYIGRNAPSTIAIK